MMEDIKSAYLYLLYEKRPRSVITWDLGLVKTYRIIAPMRIVERKCITLK